MTKKHFELVANIIAGVKDGDNREELAEIAAAIFENENPRFDRDRFLDWTTLHEPFVTPFSTTLDEEGYRRPVRN